MPLLLTAHPTNQAERRLLLRVGQEARVGSSEWVEMSVSGDDSIAPEHFLVRCGLDAVVVVLDEQWTLRVNGDETDGFTLSDQCHTKTSFTAGQTIFSICWSPNLVTTGKDQPAVKDAPIALAVDDSPRIANVVAAMKMTEASLVLMKSPDQVGCYLQRLVEAGLNDDAIRFIAGTLSAQHAVNWAIQSSDLMDAPKTPLVEAIAAWSATGAEDDRLLVGEQLEQEQPNHIARWIAQAIVFSGGSMAPKGQPVIAPPKHLCGLALLTAHRWSLASSENRASPMQRWIEHGKSALEHMMEQVNNTETTGVK